MGCLTVNGHLAIRDWYVIPISTYDRLLDIQRPANARFQINMSFIRGRHVMQMTVRASNATVHGVEA